MLDITSGYKKDDDKVVFYDCMLTIIEQLNKITSDNPESEFKATEIVLCAEYDEPMSLKDITAKFPKVWMLISETALKGEIYRYNNHGDGWELVGQTVGYA